MDGKSIADSILGPASSEAAEVDDATDDESAEDTAIGATADLLIGALEAKDREGVVDALRALVTMIRDGG